MARAIWTGTVSFGLVNVPVKLFTAVSEKTVRFNQISAKTGARIRQKRVDPTTDKEVAFEDIVKGYEITPDRYVLITPEELEALAPKKTRSIDIEGFVDLDEIDPLLYDDSYYLGPSTGAGRAYQLLVRAMLHEGKVGIGRVVLRTKEKLVALRAIEPGLLVCSTLMFADEVNDPSRVEGLDEEAPAPSERELQMAEQLIASLSQEFDHSAYQDDYRAQVLDLVERKASGESIEAPAAQDEPAVMPDLMAALEASLANVAAKHAEPEPAAEKPAKKSRTKGKAKSEAKAAASLAKASAEDEQETSAEKQARREAKAAA